MVQKLKRIKRELVQKGAIVNMYKDSIELPDGKVAEWDFIEHRKGAAAVLAVLPDGRILMVRQYRNALDRETLEIPAGARDSVTEDTAICAKRELEEETGICPYKEQIKFLKTVFYEPYHLFMEVYLVEAEVTLKDLSLQESEITQAMFVTQQELELMLAAFTDLDKQIYQEIKELL